MSTFTLDKVHSAIAFQVKHMMISKAKGEFKDFDVKVSGDINDLVNLQIEVEIDVNSINTNNEDRDNHLRSADFFDAENHPKITLKSEAIKKISDNEYELTAQVTIRGTTQTETFTVEHNGTAKNPMDGSTVTGFDVTGKINREAYGLTWNAALETRGVLVGRDVTLNAGFEFIVES